MYRIKAFVAIFVLRDNIGDAIRKLSAPPSLFVLAFRLQSMQKQRIQSGAHEWRLLSKQDDRLQCIEMLADGHMQLR